MSSNKLTLTMKEAEELTGLSYYALRQIVSKELVKAINVCGKIHINKKSLLNFIQEGESNV